ncbi:hydrogenase expression/formation protein HypE [Sulfurovum sp.]|jgi:hydrogenase expression/formation protein HypE|uniref:hydrogenase expression/formation protein HypE n=1 Tax=Sulfurovum sp. TaxID=1969726 RepID=UPI002A36A407|nr:hydrogenase expression/formation protein HypE [Sulfurovum sp.]MDD2450725.1 hydrogenase expression/formation protein HypE [Sulfurovum sp.]MDD3499409.1 hydrogenase expression/formation protein HypE [Sulfurovum sp.]MDY0403519.1 hydrogenase expression/formation protein HypE [Sulfurovum sp.]
MKSITLAHGNGGEENGRLIEELFYRHFQNKILHQAEDAAVIGKGALAFTTDSFTVTPLFFKGGDIGKLSICGTCNDLAMMGAKPKYLTCAVIIEEGFEISALEKIVLSMKYELEKNGAIIVSGDTKVVPKGSVDKLFINTTGIGEIRYKGISANALSLDDVIIVSGSIGRHGASIFLEREGMEFSTALESDCRSLWPVVEKLIEADIDIKAMRDATRGGVAAVLNEWARQSDICIEVEEEKVPISREVKGVCELLGFEAFSLANEGTFILAVSAQDAPKALELLRSIEASSMAEIIGEVTTGYPQKVLLKTPYGTSRFLELPSGELLPRIC